MGNFKCKMCGGEIVFSPGDTVGECDSCGVIQTLPIHLDDERRANLYDRANHFRRNNEFDKAEAIYEQLLAEDSSDAEVYWSIVLCQYGVEYVEDSVTHKRVPTVNRMQYTSILNDSNYKLAVKYADSLQRTLYEQEATAINEIQKGILEISQKEDPFDIFICYKETDINGRRTPDSVLANDLYYQLTKEGYKVFFSRITLEDKFGTAYEPYIFAALNSAKIMIVLGTKPEYFNSAWVKNEWSRYLALVKHSSGSKTLIPAYKGMDPYDMPEEFSHLQALDMDRLGFSQDLIHGINKLLRKETVVSKTVTKPNPTVASFGNPEMDDLYQRASVFLEDGLFDKAEKYFDKMLNLDMGNAQAFYGKLMAEMKVRNESDFSKLTVPLDANPNYSKVLMFGDVRLADKARKYNENVHKRIENLEKEKNYNEAMALYGEVQTIYSQSIRLNEIRNAMAQLGSAQHRFESLSGYRNADEMANNCRKLREAGLSKEKDAVYTAALSAMSGASSIDCQRAKELFRSIEGWKNADELKVKCEKKIKLIDRLWIVLLVIVVGALITGLVIKRNEKIAAASFGVFISESLFFLFCIFVLIVCAVAFYFIREYRHREGVEERYTNGKEDSTRRALIIVGVLAIIAILLAFLSTLSDDSLGRITMFLMLAGVCVLAYIFQDQKK